MPSPGQRIKLFEKHQAYVATERGMAMCVTGVSVGGRTYTRKGGKAGGLTEAMPGPKLSSLRL